MAACSECGFEYDGDFKFCPDCTAPQTASSRSLGEERKVVTALFCDLVGFTAISESADPEDVDQMLTRYFSVAQAVIEAHGGVVEKFIGDAVVGVFGVPAAHEDDPERAVRAGLRIVEAAEGLVAVGDLPLRLRIGINTGDALVRLGVTPRSGERFLAGDAINTASRIQSVAPEMGVAVGLATYEATARVFDYHELSRATLKGKADPVRVFQPKAPLARFGTDITRAHGSPFIGREIDLALLKGIFDKTVAAESVQLVTVTGEPGLGKSRIVAELFNYVDQRPDFTTWRQGRCLPYGEGITFWALGEIVKAHAGILESDPSDVATTKLDAVLPEGSERAWFRQRLLPLLGIEANTSAEREELFTAWSRFLEHIAEDAPTVLVFEDLHWADDAMLAFIEHLAEQAEGVPLLLVGTTRPELFEHSPGFAAGVRASNSVGLAPLSPAETARLVAVLLESTVLPADLQQAVLGRAGGNPLYAEEYVRLLKDRGLVTAKGSSWELPEGTDVPLPESVQALIAARLDTLAPEAKSLLADAAVVGKVFWADAVAAMGARDVQAVTALLRELSRKELVRLSRHSSIDGQAEYAFWHVLTRDVAYAQLPRAARASRHVAAAEWIGSMAGDRVEDHAEVIAYHYSTALELARATGDVAQARDWGIPALRFLTLAGDRALGLNTGAALANFERALALTPPGHPDRADALARLGQAAFHAGQYAQASEALDEAVAEFHSRGDLIAVARAMPTLEHVLQSRGDARWADLPAEALALLRPLPPSPVLVDALSEVARAEALQERHESAIAHAEEAISVAEELALGRPARALGFRGMGRAGLGDSGGLADYREAITLASEAGQGREVALLQNNLGCDVFPFEGAGAAVQIFREGIAFAMSRGIAEMVDATESSLLGILVETGEFGEAMAIADELGERLDESDTADLVQVRGSQVRVLALTGRVADAIPWLDWLESASRGSVDPQRVVLGLGSSILARACLGENQAAAALLAELEAVPGGRLPINYAMVLPVMVRIALAVDQRPLAERLVTGVGSRSPYEANSLVAATAALLEARGALPSAALAYADAAGGYEHFGVVVERAFALLGQGRCLVGLSRLAEAATALREAREIFGRIGALPALAETDTLLLAATALSS